MGGFSNYLQNFFVWEVGCNFIDIEGRLHHDYGQNWVSPLLDSTITIFC